MIRILLTLTMGALLWPVSASCQFLGVTPRAYYYAHGQVQELWWNRTDNTWHARAIGQEANAPSISDSLGLPTGFGVGPNLDPRVYYATANLQFRQLQVEELAWNRSDNTWHGRNVSQEVNAPSLNLRQRGLTGFGVGANRDPRVYYVSTDNHVQELAWFGDTWHVRDISQEMNAPEVVYCPVSFGVGTNLDPRVYCVDTKQHFQEFAWFNDAWHLRDISQESGALIPITVIPVGFGAGTNLDPHIYYFSGKDHLEELAWSSTDQAWQARDILQAANSPASAGTELLVGFAVGQTVEPRLYYVDAKRQVEELALGSIDNAWHARPVSQPGSVPDASFGAGCAVGANLDPRVYYFDSNHQVRELAGSSSGNVTWQNRAIAQEANAIPETSIGRLLAFGVDAHTVRLEGDNFQAMVDQYPAGTTFIVSAGDHRMQQVVPKDGDVFVGELDGAGNRLSKLSGAKLLKDDDWALAENGYWMATAADIQPGIRNGVCEDAPDVNTSIKQNLPCIFPESLLRDDKLLRRAGSINDLIAAPDTWFFDYTNQKIYIASDPRGRKMEISITPFAFGYTISSGMEGKYEPERVRFNVTNDPRDPDYANAVNYSCNPYLLRPSYYRQYPRADCGDQLPNPNFPNAYDTYKPSNVVVKNLIVEKYANPAQTGAIGYFRPGLSWQIINNEVSYNNGSGIKFKGSALVQGNKVHDNGDFGIECGDGNTLPSYGGHLESSSGTVVNEGLSEWGYWGGYAGKNAIVKDNVIKDNNVVLAYHGGKDMRISPGWGAGGAKFSQAENLLVLNNLVEGNFGPGLWTDFAYDGTIYIGNTVRNNPITNNSGAVFHEVSGSADILCNKVENNTFSEFEAFRSAQIFVSNSRLVNIRYNEVIVPSDVLGGNGITIDDSGNRKNEEIPAMSFADAVYENNITFQGRPVAADGTQQNGIVGAGGSLGLVITNPDDVIEHLGSITFDRDYYHVADVDEEHWRWEIAVNGELADRLMDFPKFQAFRAYGTEQRGTIDTELTSRSMFPVCDALKAAAQRLLTSRQ